MYSTLIFPHSTNPILICGVVIRSIYTNDVSSFKTNHLSSIIQDKLRDASSLYLIVHLNLSSTNFREKAIKEFSTSPGSIHLAETFQKKAETQFAKLFLVTE